MRTLITILACTALTMLMAGTASAEDLQGRIALTGRLGAIIAADSTDTATVPGREVVVETDAGFIGGGGVLFGVSREVAVEIDITHASYRTDTWGDADLTTISFGGQYRLPERSGIVPYVGAGIDVLIPDLENHSVDTVAGVHLAAGLDFFLNRQVAVNVEVKGVEGFEADVRSFNGTKVGFIDPTNLAVTVGGRFFFN